MQFSKVVVILATLSQALGAHATKVQWSSDSMKKFAKVHCAGQPEHKNEATCKDYCADTELSAGDSACKDNALDAAAIAKAEAEAKDHDAKMKAAAEAKAAADLLNAKIDAKNITDATNNLNGNAVPVVAKTEYAGPERTQFKTNSIAAENKALFEKYCDWSGDVRVSPVPKYAQPLVKRAASILTNVSNLYSKDFYFYPETKKFYRDGVEKGPSEYSQEARVFLTQTCGEFRDRAEMVEAKIKWVNNMFILPDEEQRSESGQNRIDYKKNIWSQLSGRTYNDYLIFADTLFSARAAQAKANNYVLQQVLGSDAEASVSPNTVCETKYIIGKYLAENRRFDNLTNFSNGLKDFEANPAYCSPEDKEYYYNFRGDANFKEYSGESNAMIWHARSIGRYCSSSTQANGKDTDVTNEVCSEYVKSPFLTRYNAARSGLAAWLLYKNSDEHFFADQTAATTILPKFDKSVGKIPFKMRLSNGSVINNEIELLDSTLGFNKLFNLGNEVSANLTGAFERLKHAVNRHTNWYKSEYHNESSEDGSAPDEDGKIRNDFKNQAYSPFVASSYEMSKSNQFAQCGYTIQCPNPENRKAWMFVFKIKKSNWYTTESLAANKPLDFDKAWLDETTFGTDRLAQIERAFDRMGSPIDEEFDSILYLRNLNGGGHGTNDPNGAKPVANDKLY